MSVEFGSPIKSTHGFSIKSSHDFRGNKEILLANIAIGFTESENDIFEITQIPANKYKDIGENTKFSAGTTPSIRHMIEYKKKLYATGNIDFTSPPTITLNEIVKYDDSDGTWKILQGTDLNSAGREMCIFNKTLCVVGGFSSANGVANTDGVAFWDNENWLTANTTSTGFFPDDVVQNDPYHCEVYKDELYVMNEDDTASANRWRLMKYDGTTWTGLFADQLVGPLNNLPEPFFNRGHFLHVHKEFLYMGIRGKEQAPGTDINEMVWKFDGVTGTMIASQIKDISDEPAEDATSFKGKLIVCGSFTEINGVAANRVASYDPDLDIWEAMGNGLNGDCTDVHVVNGILYVIGTFTGNGDGDPINKLAKWDTKEEKFVRAVNETDITTITDNFSPPVSKPRLETFKGKLKFEPES